MTEDQSDDAQSYALDLIDVIKRHDHVPHHTHVWVFTNTLWFLSHRSLEDATLHARLEEERRRLLEAVDSTRLLIRDWQPMTPSDQLDELDEGEAE